MTTPAYVSARLGSLPSVHLVPAPDKPLRWLPEGTRSLCGITWTGFEQVDAEVDCVTCLARWSREAP